MLASGLFRFEFLADDATFSEAAAGGLKIDDAMQVECTGCGTL